MRLEKLKISDLSIASSLIEKAFDDSVAPTLSKEGIATFKSGLTLESIKKRLSSGNLFIVCRSKSAIVGVGEIRDKNHLNLLFVEPSMQKVGIGRKIFYELLRSVKESEVTVNSSLNSIGAYKQFGFIESDVVGEVKGIKYQPMVYKVEPKT
ncbi:GNAT family N-acetyltransferase [Microbulbifer sp. 2304DJ12-6]|uniref:GNAT family N-acetyltransferase n=1 Tax=Microbulbifer sp. 2304DJ12-6 TaxID=3233340 RepID=UPI0039AF5559